MSEALGQLPGLVTADPASVTVGGFVPNPLRFDIEALQRLPRKTLGPTLVNCLTGREVAQVQSYVGVRLTDLLEQAGLPTWPRADLKRCIIVASGLDGYEAIFSWNEMYNTAVGAEVIVLHERDGKPLDAHLGRLCLISAADTHLGPRHLRQLNAVTVRRL